MPLRPRHGYAADLHRDLPNRRHQPAREFPAIRGGCASLPSPHPPGWSWCFSLERRSAAGSSRTPSRLASRTRPVWQYQAVPALSRLLPTLTDVSSDRAAPSFYRTTAMARRRWSLTPVRLNSASRRSISQLHTWLGAKATSSGLTVAGWVAWRRRCRLSPAWRSSR